MIGMSLTEISYYIRRSAPYAIIVILLFFILFYAFKIFFLYLGSQKTVPVTTNPVFGVIKAPRIEDAQIPSGQFTYSLDTIEGRPIDATGSAKVFFLPKSTTKFGYTEKIALMAQGFGIDTDAVHYKLDGQQASFVDDKNTLTVDIASFNFAYQYSLAQDLTLFDNVQVPESSKVEQDAKELLQKIDRYPEELAQGKVNIVYLHYEPSTTQITVVPDPNQANMVEADFYRPDIDQYPMVSAKYFNSQNFVAMVYKEDGFKVVKAQVKMFDTSKEQVGLYPLKTGAAAFEKLKAGEAIFVNVPQTSNVVIKKMFLGYLDPDVYQEYLQPVFVFLGDNNFTAYVPAVSDEYLAK